MTDRHRLSDAQVRQRLRARGIDLDASEAEWREAIVRGAFPITAEGLPIVTRQHASTLTVRLSAGGRLALAPIPLAVVAP